MKKSLFNIKTTYVIFGSLFSLGGYVALPASVFAHCPLCVAGAAVGLSLARTIGVDDSITGIWIGAFLGSISFWFYSWLVSKKISIIEKFNFLMKPLIYVLIWGSTLWSFYKFQLVVNMSKVYGLDKLTLGMIVGAVLFYLIDAVKLKHYFNYQKIVFSLGGMILVSLLMYIFINFMI
ncbi:hypothetical protein M1563_01495 [Patescibacteria group bacterium]|nr:hypothetical protein [Patescibacteria group bacterium]